MVDTILPFKSKYAGIFKRLREDQSMENAAYKSYLETRLRELVSGAVHVNIVPNINTHDHVSVVAEFSQDKTHVAFIMPSADVAKFDQDTAERMLSKIAELALR